MLAIVSHSCFSIVLSQVFFLRKCFTVFAIA
jgi:hypothetical protein